MDAQDPRLDALAPKVEVLLWLVIPAFAYEAVASAGVGRLLFGPAAVGLTLMMVLHRFVGVPGQTLFRWIAGLVGAVFVAGALGVLAVGVLFVTRGSFGTLAGMVAIPVALGMGVWGWALLTSALADPERQRRLAIDPERARLSPAVRRFDALHRPEGPGTAAAGPPPGVPGTGPTVDGSEAGS